MIGSYAITDRGDLVRIVSESFGVVTVIVLKTGLYHTVMLSCLKSTPFRDV